MKYAVQSHVATPHGLLFSRSVLVLILGGQRRLPFALDVPSLFIIYLAVFWHVSSS
jgi:hypothetical protein